MSTKVMSWSWRSNSVLGELSNIHFFSFAIFIILDYFFFIILHSSEMRRWNWKRVQLTFECRFSSIQQQFCTRIFVRNGGFVC
jgi:hypothetical protein